MHSLLLVSLVAALGSGGPSASSREPSWIPIGPTGGSVRGMACDPRDPERMWLGTPSGILYRSDDGGRRWQRLSPGFPRRNCSLDEIVVDRRGVVYIGFWEVGGKGGGVARSTDGGVTFAMLKGIDGESVRGLAIAPTNPRMLAAATLNAVFLSRDAGKTWARITPEKHKDLLNFESLAFDPVDPKILYAGTRHLAWKTADAGATWEPIHKGMIDDSHVMTLTIDREARDHVFATACTGIYHSVDGGQHWNKYAGIPDSSRRTPSFVQCAQDPALLVAGTTEGLWLSENSGGTWRLATPKDLVVNRILMQPDGTILLGTEEEGVLRSADRGVTWHASNFGFTERFVTRLVFDRHGKRVFGAVLGARPNGGVFTSSGVRGPWTRLGEGLTGRQVLSLALLEETLFAGTDEGIFVRAPEDLEWKRLGIRIDGRAVTPRVTELLALPSGHLLAAAPTGMIVSPDAGRTWAWSVLRDVGEVSALAQSPGDPQTVVAATSKGFFSSETGGVSWKHVSTAAGAGGIKPNELMFVPGDEKVLLAATPRGLFRSVDLGATWKAVGGGLPHSDLTGLAALPDGRTLFASDFTHGGIFRSTDGGGSWQRVSTRGLPSDRVWMLDIDPTRPDHLLATSPAGGLHLLPAATASMRSAAAEEAPEPGGSASWPRAAGAQRDLVER